MSDTVLISFANVCDALAEAMFGASFTDLDESLAISVIRGARSVMDALAREAETARAS